MEAPPDRQELIAAWMSGYFNASRNQPTVDLSRFATNKKLVEKYCKRRKKRKSDECHSKGSILKINRRQPTDTISGLAGVQNCLDDPQLGFEFVDRVIVDDWYGGLERNNPTVEEFTADR